ncbi:class-II aminoacyl-tRNA synthetase family protein [Jatrophihabitans lederbergiae]|uniref:Aminoacyl-transfer RNA synthetases class-II family profile domain-containing protein n=1 Tax=Jatrophihabitans lederbergiae TaxID=3075547 RepID=A0ABU2JCL7_9ACTN|nr:hypothetical protein [Jatrophihabitans sp. DSM 44399]MDT0262727.1 hypothetical protein [Jatrophihabitans sp. DSM 44399]
MPAASAAVTTPAELGGIAALGPEATTLLQRLDGIFESWGRQVDAVPMIMPPLLPVARLAALDYYRNFPHQAMVVAPLQLSGVDRSHEPSDTGFLPEALEPASLGLPSAACYGIYLHLAGQQLDAPMRVTVLGRCFRREDHYEDLRRLLGFHMREVVAIGPRDYVDDHLRQFTSRVRDFATRLDLPLQRVAATDPFYDRGGSRAVLAQLSPVKHEFVYEDLAIASTNIHRNFFGERCEITLAETGGPVFTSCVAFGLERWVSALTRRFGGWDEAHAALNAVEGITGALSGR